MGLRECVASDELFQIEQFTLVDLERDAAAQAEGGHWGQFVCGSE